jgi:archaellum component FlaC
MGHVPKKITLKRNRTGSIGKRKQIKTIPLTATEKKINDIENQIAMLDESFDIGTIKEKRETIAQMNRLEKELKKLRGA